MKTKNTLSHHSVRRGGSESFALSEKIGRSERSPSFSGRNKFGMTDLYGFTLVELIVVITILVILGTIAFLNMGNLSSGARDSARVSDMANISKGLDIYRVKNGMVPAPTGSGLAVLAGTWGLGIQGYAGDTVVRAAGLSWEGKDPLDQTYYTYSTDTAYTKYQLMAFLEDGSTKTAYEDSLQNSPLLLGEGLGVRWIDQADAATTNIDYSTRIPASRGDELGILLGNSGSDTNRPLQELYDASYFTGVNVQNFTGTLSNGMNIWIPKAVLNSTDTLSGSLANLQASYTSRAVSYSSSWAKIDKNCNKPDVVVGSQTWAGCNSTLGTLAINYVYDNGSTNCYNYAGSTGSCASIPTGKTSSTMTEADYLPGQSDNIFGALYEWTGSTTAGMFQNDCFRKGIPASDTACPCKAGYHIPSQDEWDTLEVNLGCSGSNKKTGDAGTQAECTTDTTDATNGLGWTSVNANSLKNRLGFTLGGRYTGSYTSRGIYGMYWSSSTYVLDSTKAWRRHLDSSKASVYRTNNLQTNASSVRCVRD